MTIINSPYLTIPGYSKQLSVTQEKEFQRTGAELSSGGSSSDYSQVKDVKQFIDQEISLDRTQRYRGSGVLNMQRLSFTTVKTDELRQIANDLQQEISLFRSSSLASSANLQLRAQDMMNQVQNILNSSFNGQYIFSGTATSTPASRDLSTLPPMGTNDPIDPTLYYTGNEENLTFKADDNNTITTTAKGSDQGIAELIDALRLTITFNLNGDGAERLARANDLSVSASNNIIIMNSLLRQSIQTLDHVQENLLEQEQKLSSDIKESGYATQTEAMQRFFQAQNSLMLTKEVTIKFFESTRDLVSRLR